MKATRLIIEHSTKEDDLVLIPFGGSGTEVIAYKQLKRRWVCSENNTEYVALINKRLKQKNIHHFQNTQKPFDSGFLYEKTPLIHANRLREANASLHPNSKSKILNSRGHFVPLEPFGLFKPDVK
jgi:hypothetical protein